MKAALYHRVSTSDQNETNARDELQAACRGRGWEIAMSVEETGSGARNDRPGLQKVLEAVHRGRIKAVLVWKLDRFGRSVLDVLSNVQALERAGCEFVCVSQGIHIKPGGDAMSKLTLTIMAGFAEFERDLIRERTRLGMAAAKARGVRVGRKPVPGGPTKEQVLEAKKALTWPEVAQAFNCTVAQARGRAYGAKWKGLEG